MNKGNLLLKGDVVIVQHSYSVTPDIVKKVELCDTLEVKSTHIGMTGVHYTEGVSLNPPSVGQELVEIMPLLKAKSKLKVIIDSEYCNGFNAVKLLLTLDNNIETLVVSCEVQKDILYKLIEANASELKRVYISNVSSIDLSCFNYAESLVDLEVSASSFESVGSINRGNVPRLRYLTLIQGDNSSNELVLDELSYSLKKLYLSGVEVTVKDPTAVFEDVDLLGISNCNIGDSDVPLLVNMYPNVTILGLPGNKNIENANGELDSLKRLKLRQLYLENTFLRNADFAAELDDLVYLNVEGTLVPSLKALEEHKSLVFVAAENSLVRGHKIGKPLPGQSLLPYFNVNETDTFVGQYILDEINRANPNEFRTEQIENHKTSLVDVLCADTTYGNVCLARHTYDCLRFLDIPNRRGWIVNKGGTKFRELYYFDNKRVNLSQLKRLVSLKIGSDDIPKLLTLPDDNELETIAITCDKGLPKSVFKKFSGLKNFILNINSSDEIDVQQILDLLPVDVEHIELSLMNPIAGSISFDMFRYLKYLKVETKSAIDITLDLGVNSCLEYIEFVGADVHLIPYGRYDSLRALTIRDTKSIVENIDDIFTVKPNRLVFPSLEYLDLGSNGIRAICSDCIDFSSINVLELKSNLISRCEINGKPIEDTSIGILDVRGNFIKQNPLMSPCPNTTVYYN